MTDHKQTRKQIRVVIAEDQTMMLGALAALLELEADISVVAQARNGKEALEAGLGHPTGRFYYRYRDAGDDRSRRRQRAEETLCYASDHRNHFCAGGLSTPRLRGRSFRVFTKGQSRTRAGQRRAPDSSGVARDRPRTGGGSLV